MKRGTIVICTVLLAGAITAFVSKKKTYDTVKTHCAAPSIEEIDLSFLELNTFENQQIQKRMDLNFRLAANFYKPINKSEIKGAKSLFDLIEHFPDNWIERYVSTTISTEKDGQIIDADGIDPVLTQGQLDILRNLNINEDFIIDVKFIVKNAALDTEENDTMHLNMSVIPEKQAEFDGFFEPYLEQFDIDIIPEQALDFDNPLRVLFVIDENGKVLNPELNKSSGSIEADALLIEIIEKMPNFFPAENADGVRVKQNFELRIGLDGC